jgi:hypothetical protein
MSEWGSEENFRRWTDQYQPIPIEEEIKALEEASAKVPAYAFNSIRPLLRKMKGQIEIVADSPEEQHLADQLALLMNYQLEKERLHV